jgi:energy-coupling factor transporter ATP-binding protein EcfA2
MGLKDRIPSIFPIFREGSDIGTVVDVAESEFDAFGTDTTDVQGSLFVETAEGQSLDLIAEELSVIARRRGRGDAQYRQFLQGLVPAFGGRGTERDVEVAVGAGVTFDPDRVDLIQDFQNREYQVELLNSDWIAHSSTTTRTLADLADPVGVDRVDPVVLRSETGEVAVSGADTETSDLDRVGLSSADLEPLSTDGFVLSTREAPSAGVVFQTAETQFATNFTSPVTEPSITTASTTVTTQTTDGLSSVQLGAVSTIAFEPLST